MFFKKKKEETSTQMTFESKDGRVVYDRELLMYLISPTKEELDLIASFDEPKIELPENPTSEDIADYEYVMSENLYNLFILSDPKNFEFFHTPLKIHNEEGVESNPTFVCSFLTGASYNHKTNICSFFVNPLYYHAGNVECEVDLTKKYDEIPEITIFQEIYSMVLNSLKSVIEEQE